MAPERWQQIKEIFQNAHELEETARPAYLDEACAGDPSLRAEVESLLAADEKAPSFFEKPAAAVAPLFSDEPNGNWEGRRIGPYRLQREIGRGGMGLVYLAARDDGQYQKQAAVKLIKRGMDTDEILRRFRHERQTLATLDHPNIARLLDGGVTEEGLPYFVMEYIDGLPIDVYCDSHQLNTVERLKLFRQVCAAVQYAHQNLIVHRDLKPSNILVTKEGVPKLLDFGIAKLLQHDASSPALEMTMTGMRLLTPDYASPEQARGEAISTVSDVYSLGVLLYKLLTGHRPYRFTSYSPAEIERVICEMVPEKPSTAISRVEPANGKGEHSLNPEIIGSARDGSPQKLRKRLRGDIDNIVLKALRKEPQRRYSSVEQFSEDIRRHLQGLPVIARPDTLGYRAGKFVQRHKFGVAAASLLVTLALGFGIMTKVQANRIALERDKAEQVSQFLVDIFQVSDPSEARGDTITAREILAKGAERISKELRNQQEVQATLMDVIGRVYHKLGLYEKATPILETALVTRQKLLGTAHPEVAASLNHLASLQIAKGNFVAADSLLQKSLEIRHGLFGKENLEVAENLANLASLSYQKEDYKTAEPFCREALNIRRKLLGAEHLLVCQSMSDLAIVLTRKRDFAAADSLLRTALAIQRKLLGAEHPEVASALYNLAELLGFQGDLAGAMSSYREALALRRKILGNDHPDVAITLGSMAGILLKQGNSQEALAMSREALTIIRKNNRSDIPDAARILYNLASALHNNGEHAAAVPLYREVLTINRKRFGNESTSIATILNSLAAPLYSMNDFKAAESLYREALAMRRKLVGNEHLLVCQSLNNLASLLYDKGEFTEAEKLFREAVKMRDRILPAGAPFAAASLANLGSLLVDKGSFQEAEGLLRESLQIWHEKFSGNAVAVLAIAETENAFGSCLAAEQLYSEAESLLVNSYLIIKDKRGEQHIRTRRAIQRLVRLYQACGKPGKAAEYRALLPAP
jgi:serine/threonine-protein kinase